MEQATAPGTSLLDTLAPQLHCGSLSDLHYLSPARRRQLAKLAGRPAPEAADVRQWNDTVAYVTGRPSCASAEEARALLLTLLSQA